MRKTCTLPPSPDILKFKALSDIIKLSMAKMTEEEKIKEKIKTVLEAHEPSEEQQAHLQMVEEEKQETLEKIKLVLESKEAELEKAAEEIAPEFDYDKAAEELEIEEAVEEFKALFGIELLWANFKAELAELPLIPEEVSPSKYPRPRYEARTKIGAYFTRDIHRLTMAAWIVVFALVVSIEAITYAVPATVKVSYQSLSHIKTLVVETRARTVGDLKEELLQQGYKISQTDAVLPSEDARIKNNMSVRVMKAHETDALVAGKKKKIFLIAGTVEENLLFNDISYDGNDEIKPALDTKIDKNTKIVVNEVHYKKAEKQEKVEAVNKVILDPQLGSGIEKRTEGNDGEGIFDYTYKYVNGKKTKTKRKVKEWIVKPHDNILHLGTSATGNKGEYIVVRTFTANCTAYTAKPGAGGALGLGVHRGTCAVDPRFIPYRSEMWIAGYGYAFANDCGGAVKNNVVDLFMNSTAECIQWGRRNMTAYVLQPVK